MIPAVIKMNGVSYKVTSIAPKAFAQNTFLQKVIIGRNIKVIGKQAFYQCRNLRYILVKTDKLTLKNIGEKAFSGGYYAPRVKTHKAIWMRYSNIFILRGMSKKALFVIEPVKLVI